jgi:hypothetical protein
MDFFDIDMFLCCCLFCEDDMELSYKNNQKLYIEPIKTVIVTNGMKRD